MAIKELFKKLLDPEHGALKVVKFKVHDKGACILGAC